MRLVLLPLVVVLAALLFKAEPTQAELLDFEAPLPAGLTTASFVQGADVPSSAKVTDQYLSLGVRVSGAALVTLDLGHAASGVNGLAGVNADNRVDYRVPVSFEFFSPNDNTIAATNNYFSYSPDLFGNSNNVVTISAYGLDGTLLGQATYVETAPAPPLFISGVGEFHTITVQQTLFDLTGGGIGIDLVQFGDISPVPEPNTLVLMLALGALTALSLRRKVIEDRPGRLEQVNA
jgi:hypothetical protein